MPEINSGTIYSSNYCVHYLSGTTKETCDQRTSISSMSKEDIKEVGTSVLFNAGIMVSIIFVVWFLLKGLFRVFFRQGKTGF